MKREALRACSFFRAMTSEELDEIVAHSVERRFPRKAFIFHRGDAGSSLMVVLSGAIDICIDAADGSRKITLRRIDEHEIFGEIALLDGKSRSGDAVAAVDSTLIMVERRVFLPFLLRRPELVEAMFEVLCGRIRSTSVSLEEVTLLDAPTRLARVLCRLAQEYGRPLPSGGVLIDLKMSDQELSNLLGALARETVNRHIKLWTDARLVEKVDNQIVVHDLDRLRAIGDRLEPTVPRPVAPRAAAMAAHAAPPRR